MQELHLAFAHVHVDQAVIAADAVLGVHHGIAGAQLGQVTHHGFDVAGAFLVALAAPAGRGQPGVQIVLGQEGQAGAGQAEARGQRRGGDAEVRVRGQEGLDAVGLGVGRDAELVEHLHQRLAAAGGIGAQQQAVLASLDQCAQLGDRILGAARHADVGRGAEIGMRLAGGERQAAEILQLAVQRFRVQEQRRRRQHRALAVALEKAVPAGRILAEALHGVVDVSHGDGDRVVGQIVEQRRGLVEEQRQVVFDAGEGNAVADVLVGQGARGIAFEHLAKARAEAIAGFFIHGELAARQQAYLAHRIQAALGIDVEAADGLDLVVEQVQPVGQDRAHREQIDQPAAQTELAGRGDLGDVVVVRQRQLRAQRASSSRSFCLNEKV